MLLLYLCACLCVRAAAWLASHVRRDTILRCLGGVAMCAIALTTVSLLYAQGTAQFLWLCASLALWGVAQVCVMLGCAVQKHT